MTATWVGACCPGTKLDFSVKHTAKELSLLVDGEKIFKFVMKEFGLFGKSPWSRCVNWWIDDWTEVGWQGWPPKFTKGRVCCWGGAKLEVVNFSVFFIISNL